MNKNIPQLKYCDFRIRIFLLLTIFFNTQFALTQSHKEFKQDVSTIDNIIKAYYDVVSGPEGESVNVERDLILHHPNAWVAVAYMNSKGKPDVRVMNLKEFHGDNKPRKTGFYERETNREVRLYGNMAHVWSHKAISRTPNGEPFAKGVNNITLFYDGNRWWIMGWMIDNSVETSND